MRQTVVSATRWETPQVRVLELAAPEGGDLEQVPCGSFIEIQVPQEGWRSYSLINRAGERGYKVAVQRAQGVASSWLTDKLQVGQTVGVRGPHDGFSLSAQDDAPVLMLAGGIGITPFIGMMQSLASQGRDWRLVYAVRERQTAAFVEELACYGPHVEWHVDVEQGCFLDVPALIETLEPGTHVYVCGPMPMMQAVKNLQPSRPDLRFHEQQAVHKN